MSFQIKVKIIFLVVLVLISLVNVSTATMVADFGASWRVNTEENRLETNNDPTLYNTIDTGHAIQTMTLSQDLGADGQPGFNRNQITAYGIDGNYKTYVIYFEDRNRIASNYTTGDANRMVIYTRIPNGEFEFHLGTYSQNPNISTTQLGPHFYHWFNLKGNNNEYWTKIIMNRHPQNEVGVDARPPNDPTTPKYGWEYFSGMKRIYFQMASADWPGAWQPYYVDIDNIEFYREDRVENTWSINGVAVTYFGEGRFIINWQSYGIYNASHVDDRFYIKYSTEGPINTENDWNNAITVPGQPTDGWGRRNLEHTTDPSMRADFTISPVDENKTYYFAIKDANPTYPELTHINYTINADTTSIPRATIENIISE